MRSHVGVPITLLILAASAVASCTPDNPLNQVLSDVGLVCVDATGANSTALQIADAQLNTKYEDPDTGETKTGMDTALEMSSQVADAFEFENNTRDEIRQKTVETIFTDVPDGGDAAFAEAVCDDVNVNVWEALTSQGLPDNTLATTPHLLRAFGRMICGTLGESYAEAAFRDQAEDAKEAAADPAAFKAKQLAVLREQLAAAEASSVENPKLFDIPQFRRTVDDYAATPAADIASNLSSSLRMQWLAIEHQCPTRSRYGFGAGCGPFNPFPDGGVNGVLRVREGDMSCEDAKTVIRWHYFPSQANSNSPLSLYQCRENGYEEIEDAPVYAECRAIQGNPNPSTVIVTPAS